MPRNKKGQWFKLEIPLNCKENWDLVADIADLLQKRRLKMQRVKRKRKEATHAD